MTTKSTPAMGDNRLATLAADAVAGLKKVASGEDKAFEGWLAYGEALNEGRGLHDGDREFGKWKADVLGQVDQARPAAKEEQAAMWAAGNPDELKEMQDAWASARNPTLRGLHAKWKAHLAQQEADRIANLKEQAASYEVTEDLEDAELTKAAKASGLSEADLLEGARLNAEAAKAEAEKKAEAEASQEDATDRADLSMTAQQKLDAAIRRYTKERETDLQAQLEIRIQYELSKFKKMMFPKWDRQMADSRKVVEGRSGVMTKDQYKLILKALHPDTNPSDEKKAEAFNLFKDASINLLDETQDPRVPPIPKTPEDLERARAEHMAREKAKVQATAKAKAAAATNNPDAEPAKATPGEANAAWEMGLVVLMKNAEGFGIACLEGSGARTLKADGTEGGVLTPPAKPNGALVGLSGRVDRYVFEDWGTAKAAATKHGWSPAPE